MGLKPTIVKKICKQFWHRYILTRSLTQKTSDPGAIAFLKSESSTEEPRALWHGGEAETQQQASRQTGLRDHT